MLPDLVCRGGGGFATRFSRANALGGGYTNVIPIPIDEPVTKAIAGALIKSEGAGPSPAIIHSRVVHNSFNVQRHLVSRDALRALRGEALQNWKGATAA